jgi:16S rRNA (adenine1518-N6/adenine1519-N6)-dimethyltransferase
MIKNSGEIEYCFTVSKNVFSPAPRVDSAIIHIDMNNTCSKEFCDILEYSFKQKRKTIYNNLKNVFNDPKDVLNKCHIDEKKRPEQLDVEDYLLLSKYL